MTTTDVESQLTFLYDTLIDLATSADRQAARAAEFDDTMASSALFTLADQLRTMAHAVKEIPPTPPAFDLLDIGRQQIATAMLRFDAQARKTTSEAEVQAASMPETSTDATTVAMHLAAPGGLTYCGQRNPSHVTDGIRWADCAGCIDAYSAEAGEPQREGERS